VTARDRLSDEFTRQNREHLATISTDETRYLGGLHSAHVHRRGLHATNSNYDCDLCAAERNQSKEDEDNGI
jgi:hypothetical protein